MSQLHSVLLRPVMTDKTHRLQPLNQVVFRVRKDATKFQVRQAVEELFGVKVDSVNTIRMPGKPKRYGRHLTQRAGFKKAIVTLAEGENLDFYALEDALEDEDQEDEA